ncbi:MAG: HlyD family secretion protein [Clostridiales bacterium]|nr:HlyD family secretion protein [Clostridiales bacterium]
MKGIIKDISEITDSRELLESKPHAFTAIFTYIILLILLSALAWTYFGEKEIAVKAMGVVRPTERISTITTKAGGRIEQINFERGDKIEKGDILFTVEHKELKNQRESTMNTLKTNQTDLKNQEKLKKSILEETNHFDKNTEEERNYYFSYLNFSLNQKRQRESISLKRTRIRNETNEIENLVKYIKSIELGENQFANENNIYYVKYINFELQMEKLEEIVEVSRTNYQAQATLGVGGMVSKKSVDSARRTYEESKLGVERLISDTLLNTKANLEANINTLEELKIQLKEIELDVIIHEGEKSRTITLLAINKITQINERIDLLEREIKRIEENIKSVDIAIENHIIRAVITGYINVIIDITEGDLVPSGAVVATVVPTQTMQHKALIYVDNSDIAHIKKGDKIRLQFAALPHREYGELIGEITKIGVEPIVKEAAGASFFLVEVEIENRQLVGHRGEEKEIKIGMAVEAHIITKTQKILYYLLEKIDLRE